MTAARSLFEVATGAQHKAQRSFVFVRRNSYYPDDRRSTAMQKPLDLAKMTKSQRLAAAETYDRLAREQGNRNGPIGHIGLEILRIMHRIVHPKTGRLDPSIRWLEENLKRSRKAIVRALAALKFHGFLNWVRRSAPIEDAEGQGPRVKQISNAYLLLIPDRAIAMIQKLRKASPTPVDDQDRRKQAKASHKAMIDSLPSHELPAAIVDDRSFAEVLASVGGLIDLRDASFPKALNLSMKSEL